MGTVLNNDIVKINLGLFVFGTLLMALVSKLRKLFTKNKKLAIGYALFIIVTFGLTGLLCYDKVFDMSPLYSFYAFALIFLGLGTLHLYFLRRYFPGLSEDRSTFLPEFLFTLVYICFGLIAFTQITSRLRIDYTYIFTASVLFFVLPLLFYKMYEFAVQIPKPHYEGWVYPLGKEIKNPTKEELSDPKIISFEFRKKESEPDITHFRLRAPRGMEFGKLFYFFLTDYNERHPESEVEVLDENTQMPSSWVFYFKPEWWRPVRRINFHRSVEANGINENSVIICDRITKK
ncbi:TssN family type VI secretion system protein [Pareuzebyella sediminis]|uniref:TssN family type VI secretion system protein n=1 Tax=Pareuzebyella sediminis TaxID=2607998 RepID=UPI0011EE59E7|nr:TssN family type VI secretion system protein [Pareuzebyella sediminis]